MRRNVNLCGPWRFQPDPAGEGIVRGWHRPEHDAARWLEVAVPTSFDACMPVLEAYEGDGWFRREFAAPADWRGKRVVLRFEGVNYHASVWVNGEHVGDHGDGFLPFEFPIDDRLRWDRINTLVVRADNTRREGEVPGLQRGWRVMGGILREVELIATERVYLEHVGVVAEPTDVGGRVALRAEVGNASSARAAVSLTGRVLRGDRALARLSSPTQPCSVGQSIELSLSGAVPGAEAWSPDLPNLYTLQVELWADGRLTDQREVRIGFRRIEVRDGRLLLNGSPVYLTGFNRHEDSPRTGMCPDPPLARQDLLDMKAAGANFVRLCHYPHHPGELDLCDELGLLAMGEVPLMWWDGFVEGEAACARKLAAAERQLRAMLRRDGHHPSVVFWSVSNETHEQRPEVVEGNARLLRLARALDPTRLVTHASNHWREGQAAKCDAKFEADLAIAAASGDTDGGKANAHDTQFAHDDVICVNAYPSLNQRGYGGQHDYDFARSTRYWRDELAKLHARYPGKPILVSEFGYASLEGVFGNSFGEDVQAQAIAAEFAGMDAPYVCGAAVWCWADHPWPQSGFCRNLRTSPYGVVTRERNKLLAYSTIKRLFHERQPALHAPKPEERAAAPNEPHLERTT